MDYDSIFRAAIDRLHELWLRMTADADVGHKLHHRDIVHIALERLERDLDSPEKQDEIRNAVAVGLSNHCKQAV